MGYPGLQATLSPHNLGLYQGMRRGIAGDSNTAFHRAGDRMSEAISDALSRLSAALDRLDAAALRHAETDRARSTLDLELTVMREDRHRLAEMLDAETGARREADQCLHDVLPRLDKAMAAMRASLAEG